MKFRFKNREYRNDKTIGKSLCYIVLPILVAVITSWLLNLFLSGKIIEIPNETADDGFIRVLGVATIIVSMINVALLALIVLKKIDDKYSG